MITATNDNNNNSKINNNNASIDNIAKRSDNEYATNNKKMKMRKRAPPIIPGTSVAELGEGVGGGVNHAHEVIIPRCESAPRALTQVLKRPQSQHASHGRVARYLPRIIIPEVNYLEGRNLPSNGLWFVRG